MNSVDLTQISSARREELIRGIVSEAAAVYTPEGLEKRLRGDQKLTVKLGADPSRPDLHLGHTVVLRRLRLFQQLGHEVVFVVGDFTGMIGDPTGKSKTRPALTLAQTRQNGETYFRQAAKILDPEKTRVVYNSTWLSKLGTEELLRLASRFTLAQILQRDDFHTRYERGAAVGLHELLYPLLQAYDSVALRADVEVGGTDQTFNLLAGRALQAGLGQTAQEVATYPLLPGLDGEAKMSKSLDNYIGIDESPELMFEKAMRVPDPLLEDYFALTTDVTRVQARAAIDADIRQAHFDYASRIVALYHSAPDARTAEERYRCVSAGQTPEQMACVALKLGEEIGVCALIRRAGFAASNSEARRLVAGRGVRLDGFLVEDAAMTLAPDAEAVLQVGKNRFCRLTRV